MTPLPILAVKDDDQPIVEPEPGIRYRVRAGASTGAAVLTVVDRWFEPGKGVPFHRHPAGVEEVVWVQEGAAEFRVGDETATVGPDHTVIIPAETPHSFTSCGESTLRALVRYSSVEPVMIAEGIAPGTLEIPS